MIYYILLLISLFISPLQGAITFRNGSVVDADDVPTMTVDEHYEMGADSYNKELWKEAIRHFHIVCLNFPESSYAKDAYFYLGVSYYQYGELEFANIAFNNYLKYHNSPVHMEDAIKYKFLIAESFRKGTKRHMFGSKLFPAWMDASNLAKEIYDEIVLSFPSHELAAESLFAKGWLELSNEHYSDAIDNFQAVIRRFPRHELAPQAYVVISQVYVEKMRREFQNSDILSLAELNLKKFESDFPTEELLAQAKRTFAVIKEEYAKGLFETGQFYERLNKPEASRLYYQIAIDRFPDTSFAEKCQKRMGALDPKVTTDGKAA